MITRPWENRTLSSIRNNPLEEHGNISYNESHHETFEVDSRNCEIVWSRVVNIGALQCFAVYGIYLTITSAKLLTFLFVCVLSLFCCIGITAGAHRLWAHRSYKAKWPLKIFLLVSQTIAHQNSVIVWSRDHRVHHKFQETDADPHNINRGFFFAHCGWLMCKKHPEVKSKGKGIDLSDLYAEPLLRLQHKYFSVLMPIFCIILPTAIPMKLWSETFINAFCLNMLRYVSNLHFTWFVNSAAHMWGSKPFERFINATENPFVSLVSLGEGWHNYHHAFPWDYRAAELGRFNPTLTFINFCAKIGWAYDLKTPSPEMIRARVLRSGDGSHEIWGWEDKDRTLENYQRAIIHNKLDD